MIITKIKKFNKYKPLSLYMKYVYLMCKNNCVLTTNCHASNLFTKYVKKLPKNFNWICKKDSLNKMKKFAVLAFKHALQLQKL